MSRESTVSQDSTFTCNYNTIHHTSSSVTSPRLPSPSRPTLTCNVQFRRTFPTSKTPVPTFPLRQWSLSRSMLSAYGSVYGHSDSLGRDMSKATVPCPQIHPARIVSPRVRVETHAWAAMYYIGGPDRSPRQEMILPILMVTRTENGDRGRGTHHEICPQLDWGYVVSTSNSQPQNLSATRHGYQDYPPGRLVHPVVPYFTFPFALTARSRTCDFGAASKWPER